MNCNNIYDIPKEKFTFVQNETKIKEVPLTAKHSSYTKDALTRFAKNKGSVICFFIILLLALYAIFVPIFSPYKIYSRDGYFAYASPKSPLFSHLGFWNGTKKQEVNEVTYDYLSLIPDAIYKDLGEKTRFIAARPQTWHVIKVNTYALTGWVKMLLSKEEYEEALAWEKETGTQLFYPLLNESLIKNVSYKGDQNAWALTDAKGNLEYTKDKKIQDIFLRDSDNNPVYTIQRMMGSQVETRVLYKEWYKYKNGRYASFLFGADKSGYDIFTRLAYGARLSLVLSIFVASVNLFLGIIIGAIEGYYGGTVDLIIERIKDILYDVPTLVIFALFQLYLSNKTGPLASMFFAFIFYGWIGPSSTVRAQFYRFKGQDYVNASRTLGASDARLIFKHILPNSIGFIITASVLTIPGVIFSEANLTYLGIVNLEGDTMTSVGTMLNAAKDTLATNPHCLFFPAAFISILLICFNEFGNGLRDAFNPTLRGAEE